MQTPINSRDLALQNTSPRVLGISSNYVNLTCPTQQFKYGTDNAPQPALATVTASLIGSLDGIVDFVTTGLNPVPTATGNTININPEHMTGDVVTVNANLVYQGATYQAVPITISKIFNQLVAKTTRAIDLLPAYTDGSGYTLPTADNFVELYNGVVKLTTGVTYGPSTAQTKSGLTATINTTTGLITLTQASPSAWTSSSENFTFTATRGSIAYGTTYIITKAKAGTGGQQLAEVALYKWSTAQPAFPTDQSTYNWFTQAHTYASTDWSTTVPAFPGLVGLKLWKITKSVTAEALTTIQNYVFSWAGGIVRQVTTEANELIKTAAPKVYKAALSIPTIAGSSRYDWASGTIVANLATPGEPNPVPTPSGWETTVPTLSPGFTVYEASVNIIDRQSASITPIDWTTASIIPISYAGSNGSVGSNGLSAITAILTNDTHAIPTDSTGTTINFGNSGTDLFIYEGATPLVYDGQGTTTGKFTVTAAVDGVTTGAATAVTVNSATGVRYADLTGASFDKTATGSITFTITGRRLTIAAGQTVGIEFTYTVKQSFTKTPSGVQGVPGAAYWITTSASVVQKNSASVFNPATVTFTAKKSIGSTASNFTDGYVKLYRNGAQVTPPATGVKVTEYTYTIPADTTSIRYELYSDSEYTNLLDIETIPVVADGSKGDQGITGISARRAYIVVPSAITPGNSPATFQPAAEFGYPASGTWFTTNSNSITWTVDWTANAPNSIAEGFTLYQSDGLYDAATQKTTWNPPYISSLKVGNLAAISVNTGGLTITDYIKGGQATTLTAGNGFYVSSAGHMRVGNPSGSQLKFDANGLAISDSNGNNIFTVISNAAGDADQAAIDAAAAALAATNAANNATSLKVQYSQTDTTNDANWHDSYVSGDLYIRTGSKTAAQTTYTWGAAAKFVPVKNTDYFDGINGTNGSAGVNARAVDLTTTTQAFAYTSDGTTPSPANSTITATAQNTAGTVFYEFLVGATSVQNTTTNSYVYTPAAAFASMPQQITVRVREGTNSSAVVASDVMSLVAVKPGANGANAVSGLLTNESSTVPADSAGAVTSFTGTGGTFFVFDGTTSKTGNAAVTYSVASSSGLTISIATTGIYTISAMSADTASATLRAVYSGVTIDKIYSLSKSKAGTNGSNGVNARAVDLTMNAQAFAYTSDGTTPSPANSTITATAQNTAGTVFYEFLVGATSVQNTTTNSYVYTPAAAFASMPQQITVRVREGTNSSAVVASDVMSLVAVKPGANGANAVSGLLTNESSTVPADSAGAVTSFTGTGGTFFVFDGTTSKTGNAAVTYSVASSSGLTISIATTGIYTISAMSADTASATLRAVYSGVTIDKIYSLSKSKAGTNGTNGTNGANGATGPGGPRGSLQGYGSKYGITSNSWNDNLGYQIIYNMLEGDAATAGITKAQLEAAGWFMQIGDMVTITNAAQTASFTRFWDGDSWENPQVIVDGNLIATGSITAAKINTRGLDIQDANGNVIFSSGGSSLSGIGSNLLRSSGFEDGVAGYTSPFNNFPTAPAQPAVGWNFGTNYSLRGQGLAYIRVFGLDSVTTSQTFDFRDNYKSGYVAVVPSTRYEAHALLNTLRSTARIMVSWYTSDLTYISDSLGNVIDFGSEVYDLSDLRQSGVFATAPVNARFCQVIIRATGKNQTQPYVFIKNMYFGQAFQAQVTHTPWSPGRGMDQITSTNASTLLGANIVSTTMITDLAVNNAKIANASIQSAKIANLDADLIDTGVLRAGRIDVTKLIGSSTSITTIGSGSFTVPAGQTRLAINMRAAGGGGGGGNVAPPTGGGDVF